SLVWTYINLSSKLNALEKELKKTILKVNTLEHTVLPSLAGDLRRIKSVLAERERQERFAVKRLSNRKKAANVARKGARS
ncbi:MAG: V-type ATP synthase subunit D, partial [Synergistota bacterium]|nr:V-type ATP synthase subunit D [Synergistota bacterium]